MAFQDTCNKCQHYQGAYGHGSKATSGLCMIGGLDPERTERFRYSRDYNIQRTVLAGNSCPRFTVGAKAVA